MESDEARSRRGLWLGLLAVVLFSLTLPATRAALTVLLAAGARRPDATEFRQLILVALGVVFGFPFFTTWAMQQVPANHSAVVLALLPLATTLAATVVAHERPSIAFWCWAVLGAALAVGFALGGGAGASGWQLADLALLAAIASAAGGYALGAEVSRKLGGWQTISWALVISLPVNLLVAGIYWPANIREAAPLAWSGFLYVACISMYLAFFPWYRALAMGGIARVGQIQLLQPFLTFAGAALWMGEALDARTFLFTPLIAAVVAAGRRAPVARPASAQ